MPVYMRVMNEFGVAAEDFGGEAIDWTFVRHADFPIEDVWFEGPWVTPGSTAVLHIETTDDAPEPRVDISGDDFNQNNMPVTNVGPGEWRVSFTVPSTVKTYARYGAEVSIKDGGYEFHTPSGQKAPAAMLVVRRSNAPVSLVDFSPRTFTAAGTHYMDGTVEFTRFQTYEDGGGLYAMKLDDGGGAESGNFGMVDFRNVYAPPWPPLDNERGYDGSLLSNWYKDSIVDGWVGDIYIGDALYTYTGNVASTEAPLDERFGDDDMSIVEWYDAGKPASPRLLTIPVVSRVEEPSGKTLVTVVAFGAFYVEDFDRSQDLLEGYFVEYVGASGGSSTNPPSTGLFLETPHLVSEGVDF
jgi:hypothetical protein